MPDRRDRAVVGGDCRSRRSRARASGDGVVGHASDPARRRPLAAADAAVRSHGADARLHPGYVPGVRENGGQYTHAALWTVLAFARLGDGDRAMELFAMLNPANKTRDAGGCRPLPRRAVRRRRRRVLEPRAHRPRRVDVVHRVGGVDVSGRDRGAAGIDAQPRRLAHRPVHSRTTGRGIEAVVRTLQAEFRIVVENPERVTRGVRLVELDGTPRSR